MSERCVWPRCRQSVDIVYVGRGLCQRHWGRFCELEESRGPEVARGKIGLKVKAGKCESETCHAPEL